MVPAGAFICEGERAGSAEGWASDRGGYFHGVPRFDVVRAHLQNGRSRSRTWGVVSGPGPLGKSTMRHAVKDFVKRLALRRGLLVRRLPGGRQGDPFSDQGALLSGRDVRTILDVGAWVGETALLYRRRFPSARIHCFEPVPESFARLSNLVAVDPLITVKELAVGDRIEPVELHVNRSAFTSSTLAPAPDVTSYLRANLFEEVVSHQAESTTIDRYCAEASIEHIDILKLDIQGGELAALRGASEMLSRGAISVIYTEVLVAPMYEAQPRLGDVFGLFDMYDYRLFGLYNFAYGADFRLYQMDAILLSPRFKGAPGVS